MFVKALRLSGFKSFADPTILEFERGVNVIVGPNGSGKSNIADALSWVLGSQAPSSLRGGSMEDVIFAGSSGRPKLGMADVTLTLDNSSRLLPLDLHEVTISRSTDRSGASEYRINGAPCRLLDITELLSDTGIGRSIHTIVGQGQLDAILHARPEDRRGFIEEAAQIGKYRRRKERAVRKLERVDENLLRLNDVLLELRRAIRPLKRQASAAAMYSELVTRHRELRQSLAATEIHRLSSQETESDPSAEAHRAGLLSDELSNVRARLQGAASEREALVRNAEKAREVAHGITRAADRLTALGRLSEERSARIAARLAAETEEGYRERIRLLETDRDRWSGEASELAEHSFESRRRADGARATADAAREAAGDAERALAAARGTETQTAQELVRAEGSEAAGRATLGSLEARVSSVVERRDIAAHKLEEEARAIQDAERNVERLETDLDAATEKAAGAEAELEEQRDRTESLKAKLGETQAEVAAARARVGAFEEIISLFPDDDVVQGVLAPRLEAARDNERIAGSGERAARAIVERAEAEVERWWQEVARFDEELRRMDALMSGAAERLAGSRRQHEAREIELAVLDEELSRTREALASAERSATEERAALPARRRAAQDAKERREEAEAALHRAREHAATTIRQASDLELTARTEEERALAARLRIEEAEAGISDAHAALAGLEDRRVALAGARDRATRVAEAAFLAATRAEMWAREAAGRADAARARAEEGERRLTSLIERERVLAEQLDEVARRRNAAEVRHAQARARIDALAERSMDEWALGVEDLLRIEALDAADEEAAQEEVAKLDRDMRRLGGINPRAAEEYAELAERETFLQNQIEDLKSSRGDLMKIVWEVDDEIVQVFSQAYEDVAREFETVFDRLFPGGSGRLKLTDPDDLLHTGIEVEARPPGKNVRKLSLLSGGERSLVALAFLFAIFRSRPSPFYLLDEVEAALDDVNLQRFITLVKELEERAQILVVTHQKRTMEAADVLYGVSMAKDGVSLVVAKRMEEISA